MVHSMTEEQERTWSTLCHLSALAFFVVPPLGHLVGPLVVWLVNRQDSAMIDDQGREALNFQLSMMLYMFLCLVTVVGIIAIPFLFVANIVLVITAAIRAQDGERYRYPWTIRFL